ncbi:hypothetical protein V1524DRAFT_428185 [Lipomyces starkeyi]
MLIGMRMISTLLLLPSSMVQLVNSQRSFHSAYNDHLVWFMHVELPLPKKWWRTRHHINAARQNRLFPYLQVRYSFLTSSRTRINCHSTAVRPYALN